MKKPLSKSVAAEVRALIAREEIRVASLSPVLLMGERTLRRALSGSRPWAIDELHALSEHFGVPVAAFFPAWAKEERR